MGFVAQVLGASQMTKSERTLLYEFLLVLVYNSNRSDPGVLFDTIMGPVLQNDVSSLMQDVSSAETFFRFTGIPTLQEHSSILARSPLENALPADLQSALSKNAEARSFLRGAVMTIWHALRQFQNRKNKVMTNHAWQRYVGHIIPFLLASIQ